MATIVSAKFIGINLSMNMEDGVEVWHVTGRVRTTDSDGDKEIRTFNKAITGPANLAQCADIKAIIANKINNKLGVTPT